MSNKRLLGFQHRRFLVAALVLIAYLTLQLFIIQYGILPFSVMGPDPGTRPGPWWP